MDFIRGYAFCFDDHIDDRGPCTKVSIYRIDERGYPIYRWNENYEEYRISSLFCLFLLQLLASVPASWNEKNRSVSNLLLHFSFIFNCHFSVTVAWKTKHFGDNADNFNKFISICISNCCESDTYHFFIVSKLFDVALKHT